LNQWRSLLADLQEKPVRQSVLLWGKCKYATLRRDPPTGRVAASPALAVAAVRVMVLVVVIIVGKGQGQRPMMIVDGRRVASEETMSVSCQCPCFLLCPHATLPPNERR
jgi:hypothetical protein